MAYFLPRALPLLLLFIIPGVNALAPLVSGACSAPGPWRWNTREYPFGNNGIIFGQQRKVMKTRRLTALGFGGGVMLLMLIPGGKLRRHAGGGGRRHGPVGGSAQAGCRSRWSWLKSLEKQLSANERE